MMFKEKIFEVYLIECGHNHIHHKKTTELHYNSFQNKSFTTYLQNKCVTIQQKLLIF